MKNPAPVGEGDFDRQGMSLGIESTAEIQRKHPSDLVFEKLASLLPGSIVSEYISVTESAVVVLTIKGQGKPVLSQMVIHTFGTIFDALAQIDELPGVVITSEDKGIYGADAREIAGLQAAGELALLCAVEEGKAVLLTRLGSIKAPVVAAVTGTWLGGGLELALACDKIVATRLPEPEKPKRETKVGLVEVMLGVIPGFGGCWNLYNRVGLLKAIDLICSAKVISATQAWRMGVVDEVVEPRALLARAEEIALSGPSAKTKNAKGNFLRGLVDKLAMLALWLYQKPFPKTPRKLLAGLAWWVMVIPLALYKAVTGFILARIEKFALGQIRAKTKGNMPAPEAALKVLMACAGLGREKALALESTEFANMAKTYQSHSLVRAFLAKSSAKKTLVETGIDPHAVIDTIGVIGLGVMGGPIAALCAASGYRVVALDVNDKYLEAGANRIREFFAELVESGEATEAEAEKILSGITFTTNYNDLAACKLVIEVAPEKLTLKKEIKAKLDAAMNRPYYFASNTSTQSNTEIVEATAYRDMAAGIHFFNPVSRMLLVEVVRARDTTSETFDLYRAFVASLGKLPIRSRDRNGFIVNSLIGPYAIAALLLVQKGVPLDRIDRAAKDFGLPMGPFQLADLVGHDVLYEVLSTLHANFGERFAIPEILVKTRALGLLGNKGGEGFFVKNKDRPGMLNRFTGGLLGGKPKPFIVNPKVAELLSSVPEHKMSIEAIQFVLFDAIANESVRLLSEGVAETPEDIDVATVFGMGYPAYRGGPITHINRQGIATVKDRLIWESRVWGENYRPVESFENLARLDK